MPVTRQLVDYGTLSLTCIWFFNTRGWPKLDFFFLVFVQPLTLGWVWFYWFRVISHWVFGKGFWLPRSRWVLLSFIIHTTYSNSSSIMPVAVEDKCSIKMTAQPPNLGSPRLHGWTVELLGGSKHGALRVVKSTM